MSDQNHDEGDCELGNYAEGVGVEFYVGEIP